MKIENSDIRKAAEIAKIYLNEDEIETYKKNLEDMTQEFLDALDALNIKLDENFDFTKSSSKESILREDKIVEFSDTESIIKNAPSIKDRLFSVPTILKGDK